MCGEVTGLGRGCRGYEVTVGPAGIGGGGGCFCVFQGGMEGGGAENSSLPDWICMSVA